MKVAQSVIESRRQQIASLLQRQGFADVRTVCRLFDISEATTRRDLAALANESRIKRTYGGALGEYDVRFASFQQRRSHSWPVKMAIATRALTFLKPGGTYFLDAGSTVFALAQAFVEKPSGPVTIVTNNLSVAEILSRVPKVELYLIGGRFLARQSAFLGSHALKAIRHWKFDAAFLGAEGLDEQGLWNSEAEIVRFQRAILDRAPLGYFLADAGKWGHKTNHLILPWKEVDRLITDLTPAALANHRVSLRSGRHIPVKAVSRKS